ncbi:polysaccharide biosynthesis tyrosine autokinase [Planctomicrobium piriforme]|uniref:non-specific protein-tyrosine kinase n=1 Tax=Planctomicrobium piriforme TaxID=1576369 RepID=A0A1I3DDV4_9PLAN|nr:polysaccharide biosynthesis tyrosine autokinase [Planctomicrobium piriforme]SFH84651.1 capsular exopolysaccharide family [Planctomicrobium piriforme]
MSDMPQKPDSQMPVKPMMDTRPMLDPNATGSFDVVEIFRRQLPLIACCTVLGLLMAVIYWANAEKWYESSAKMLVTLKDMRASDKGESSWAADGVQDEILANHMEIVSSRRIIGNALQRVNAEEMPGIKAHTDSKTDAVDYVSEHISLTKGGQGSARDARSLNIAFRHTNPDEALLILQALVAEYESFLDEQVSRIMSEANRLITQAQGKIESDLKSLEEQYVQARQSAPIIYVGNESSNVYLDTFRRLQDELVTVDIERSAVATRLQNVLTSLDQIKQNKGNSLEMLALIDSESLTRLGTFGSFSSAQTQDFQENQATRLKEAETKFGKLIELQAEMSRLNGLFGPNHPTVENLRKNIEIVEGLLKESQAKTQNNPLFEKLTPELLLNAYTGFLRHDLSALDQRKRELLTLAAEAEKNSKSLIEFELKDKMIQAEMTRKQTLYDSIVEQLREMDTAAGLSGYIHEVLEEPQAGEEVWPALNICVAGGMFLGLCLGVLVAICNDQFDNRFRTPSEIDSALGVPVIAQVGKITRSRDKRKKGRMIVDAQAPEAESFRLLRTYLLREVKAGNLRTAMITSSQAKDGKSTILANLGASFAELGLKVLIIDGDMRAPTIHRFLNMPIDRGLSETLQGKTKLDEVIRPTGIEGLSVMTAGSAVRNPAELLQSEVFDQVLEDCKSRFDMVLVDSGPVLLVSDPAIVSQKCDIAMLVVRPAIDTKRKVFESIRRLTSSKSNLRGCILNTYGSSKEFTRDSGYYSSYNYYGYGYGYGYGNRGYGRRVKDNGSAETENGHSLAGSTPAGRK